MEKSFNLAAYEAVLQRQSHAGSHAISTKTWGILGVHGVEQQSTEFTDRFTSKDKLTNYLNTYDHPIAQRVLNHLSPIEAL